jgi:hypothetical protein
MYEYRAERQLSSNAPRTRGRARSEGSVASARGRLNGIVFVGSVLVTQLSWFGALAYAAFRIF